MRLEVAAGITGARAERKNGKTVCRDVQSISTYVWHAAAEGSAQVSDRQNAASRVLNMLPDSVLMRLILVSCAGCK